MYAIAAIVLTIGRGVLSSSIDPGFEGSGRTVLHTESADLFPRLIMSQNIFHASKDIPVPKAKKPFTFKLEKDALNCAIELVQAGP